MAVLDHIGLYGTNYEIADAQGRQNLSALQGTVEHTTGAALPVWESGSLDVSTGKEIDSDDNIRTKFIPVTPGNVYRIYWTNNTIEVDGFTSNVETTDTTNRRVYRKTAPYTDQPFYFEIQSNVHYIRLRIGGTLEDDKPIMVNLGDSVLLDGVDGAISAHDEEINQLYGLLNYGYDSPAHCDVGSGASTAIAVTRNATRVLLNGTAASNGNFIVKINNGVQRASTLAQISNFTNGTVLENGHTYRVYLDVLSGESSDMTQTVITVYKKSGYATIATKLENMDHDYCCTFTSDGSEYMICIWVGKDVTLTNLLVNVTVQDMANQSVYELIGANLAIKARLDNGTDLDTVKASGVYLLGSNAGYTNAPTGLTYGFLTVKTINTITCQTVETPSGDFARFYDGSAWGAWAAR